MIAVVKILNDNGNTKDVYKLSPSAIYDCGISTKYVFEFEYNELNDEYKAESREI